jgi:hypothetical protein
MTAATDLASQEASARATIADSRRIRINPVLRGILAVANDAFNGDAAKRSALDPSSVQVNRLTSDGQPSTA